MSRTCSGSAITTRAICAQQLDDCNGIAYRLEHDVEALVQSCCKALQLIASELGTTTSLPYTILPVRNLSHAARNI